MDTLDPCLDSSREIARPTGLHPGPHSKFEISLIFSELIFNVIVDRKLYELLFTSLKRYLLPCLTKKHILRSSISLIGVFTT